MFTACNMGGGKQTGPTHYPFKKSENDLWGLVDANGKVLFENEFKERPSLVFDGMFFVEKNGKYEVYSTSNPMNPIDERYKDIAYFSEGLAPCVKENEGIKYIDKKGEVKFELPLEYVYANRFVNGYSLIAKKEVQGNLVWDAITKEGNILKFSDYSLVAVLKNGDFVAEFGNTNTYCIIDKNGNKKAELKDMSQKVEDNAKSVISPDCKNYIFSDVDEEFDNFNDGVKNIDGKVLIKGKKSIDLAFLENGLVRFNNEDDKFEYGVMDVNGDIVIRPKYQSIVAIGKDKYIVSKESDNGWKYGLINQKEDRILGFDYDYLCTLSNHSLMAKKSDFDIIYGEKAIFQIITTKGEILVEYKDLFLWSIDAHDFWSVKSDYFDVSGCIKSLLEPLSGSSIETLYGFAGMTPGDCANKMGVSLSKDDIGDNNNWFPYQFLEQNEYGRISYSLGFQKVVETYYDDDDYWQILPHYSYSHEPCGGIRAKLQLNYDARNHIGQIEKQVEEVLLDLGYTKSGTSSSGDQIYRKPGVVIDVIYAYDDELFVRVFHQ